jgi:hypothetical protein
MRRPWLLALTVRLLGVGLTLLGSVAAIGSLYLPWLYMCPGFDVVCVHHTLNDPFTVVPLPLGTPHSNEIIGTFIRLVPLAALLMMAIFLWFPPRERRIYGVLAALAGVLGLCGTVSLVSLYRFSLAAGNDSPTSYEWGVGVLVSLLGYVAMLVGLGVIAVSYEIPDSLVPPPTEQP